MHYIYHLENMLIISEIHRLIHFSNRCAPNITNPPQYCFFSLPPPPIIPSHLNAKTQNNPNHQSIHPSLQDVLCFALFCDQGRGGVEGKWNIFAQLMLLYDPEPGLGLSKGQALLQCLLCMCFASVSTA